MYGAGIRAWSLCMHVYIYIYIYICMYVCMYACWEAVESLAFLELVFVTMV